MFCPLLIIAPCLAAAEVPLCGSSGGQDKGGQHSGAATEAVGGRGEGPGKERAGGGEREAESPHM